MKIQIFQTEIIEAEFKKNMQNIEGLFEEHYNNADIVVIPEMWNNGYALSKLEEKADYLLEESFKFIQKLALHYNTNIVAGSVSNKKNKKIYNTAFSVSKEGKLINRRDKIHLVPMLDEHLYLSPGINEPNNFMISDIPATQVVCYDLRFPEIVRDSVIKGAQIIFVVAQWTTQNLHHWRTLLQARAIENSSYVVACNSVGKVNHSSHKDNTYAGHSMIINPNGEILVEGNDSPNVLECIINTDEVYKQRKKIPTLTDIK